MVSRLGGGGGFWISCSILVVTGLFLGFRGEHAMSTVLAEPGAPSLHQDGGHVSQLPDTSVIHGKALLLEAAKAGKRDPFGHPPKARPKPKPKKSGSSSQAVAPKPKPKPKPAVPPTLRVLLYDNVDPCLKLTLKGKTSGWLRVGESWKGWTITAIGEHSATVSKAGKTITIE